jgi:hypothetical protein
VIRKRPNGSCTVKIELDIESLLINLFSKKIYRDNQNIGPCKYRFRLSIFQINYSIDNIYYRLSHGLNEDKLEILRDAGGGGGGNCLTCLTGMRPHGQNKKY